MCRKEIVHLTEHTVIKFDLNTFPLSQISAAAIDKFSPTNQKLMHSTLDIQSTSLASVEQRRERKQNRFGVTEGYE
jgi:hypothetical protein